MPSKPSNPILTKNDSFTPEIKSIDTSVITITIAVPKSGSSIMRRKNTPITSKIGSTPFFTSVIILLLLARYFETYIIKGERGSGKICLNGAAARKVQPDDIVIIMSYALMDFEEAKTFKPTVIFPDPATNKVVK